MCELGEFGGPGDQVLEPRAEPVLGTTDGPCLPLPIVREVGRELFDQIPGIAAVLTDPDRPLVVLGRILQEFCGGPEGFLVSGEEAILGLAAESVSGFDPGNDPI